ncbi:hypothetical protein HMPREF2531_00824 [Bacteroides intestinalis]|uniref:Uncharacterized protein n=1 Tax=Bacteroides intestinalis TaxID=329854 RepID=A0A139LS42_9BACE|nr:hypothetical protein HMPREF2531_00824 [Bacteroides intestinalis]
MLSYVLHCFFSIVRLFAAKVIKKDQIDKMYKHIQIPEILPNPILPADFYISYSLYLISR